jgi:hypothetical protein
VPKTAFPRCHSADSDFPTHKLTREDFKRDEAYTKYKEKLGQENLHLGRDELWVGTYHTTDPPAGCNDLLPFVRRRACECAALSDAPCCRLQVKGYARRTPKTDFSTSSKSGPADRAELCVGAALRIPAAPHDAPGACGGRFVDSVTEIPVLVREGTRYKTSLYIDDQTQRVRQPHISAHEAVEGSASVLRRHP